MNERKKGHITLSLSVLPNVYLEVATVEDLKRKKKRFTRTTHRLLTDKPLRREIRRSVAPVAALATGAALNALTNAVPDKKIVKDRGELLESYTDLVSTFAKKRKKYKAKRLRYAKEQGFSEKTGLYHPKKLASLQKEQKLSKLSGLPKAQTLPHAPKEPKAKKYKIYKEKK